MQTNLGTVEAFERPKGSFLKPLIIMKRETIYSRLELMQAALA